MADYFEGQQIPLEASIDNTALDLSSGSPTVRIYYKDPNGKKGYFTGSVSGTQLILYTMTTSESKAGKWEFQGWADWGSGQIIWGKKKTLVIGENLANG